MRFVLDRWRLVWAALAAMPLVAQGTAVRPTRAAERPNFVVFVLEGTGAGWTSTSVAMDDRWPEAKGSPALTPNMQRLADTGMRFSDFYVSAPRCTPARASLLAGMSAAKLGMTYVNEGGGDKRGGRAGSEGSVQAAVQKLIPPTCSTELPAEITTVAELVRDAGYATAHFGKWHVGRQRPSAHGFDLDDGANSNRGPGGNDKPNPEEGLAITDRSLAFMERQTAAKRPFYVQISHYGGGSEDESLPETRQALAAELRGVRGKSAWQLAILRDVDDQIGRLLRALDETKLADSTYVFVVFDHGASGRNANAPLQGGKGSVLEGGVRVPFLVRGPGIEGKVCSHVRASTADLLPTVADLAGIAEWPAAVEGGSLVPVLRGRGVGRVLRPLEELVLHFPHYDLGSAPASAIYVDDYKLVRFYEDGGIKLFDLGRDPEERRDLSGSEPERVAELSQRLDAYLKSIRAGMPRPNPAYPSRK